MSKSKHICPKCGNKTFYTSAHIVQEWLVDKYGEYLETSYDCITVAAYPDDGNIWTCAKCGAEAVIVEEEGETK